MAFRLSKENFYFSPIRSWDTFKFKQCSSIRVYARKLNGGMDILYEVDRSGFVQREKKEKCAWRINRFIGIVYDKFPRVILKGGR